MTSGRQRKIDELAELYKRHPDFRDFYVEGLRDREFFRWFFETADIHHVNVYDVGAIDVPPECSREHCQPNNNRGRIAALAKTLEILSGPGTTQATCIIDKDFDSILQIVHEPNILCCTDYACLEMYFVNEKCLDKFCKLFLNTSALTGINILTMLVPILQALFIIRFVNETLDLSLNYMSFERCCAFHPPQITFNECEYIERYLSKNGRLDQKDVFIKMVEESTIKLEREYRNQIHGHDFVNLIAWFLLKNGVERKLCDPGVVERGLIACIEYDSLLAYPLFSYLTKRSIVN
ncbi:MAG: DUF4435 domain-containing protein [Dehalogenimonas sp.]|uniref:DUF4435 domain-containing protein n=1 Tax=Candidatus Dehalogenimonas loeffleri TaxID=3127115 RepID=A0ABZ2J9U4_9CHLR|nr:DUF4435 domain-containing protein [Dehalogenimonas sp.]